MRREQKHITPNSIWVSTCLPWYPRTPYPVYLSLCYHTLASKFVIATLSSGINVLRWSKMRNKPKKKCWKRVKWFFGIFSNFVSHIFNRRQICFMAIIIGWGSSKALYRYLHSLSWLATIFRLHLILRGFRALQRISRWHRRGLLRTSR